MANEETVEELMKMIKTFNILDSKTGDDYVASYTADTNTVKGLNLSPSIATYDIPANLPDGNYTVGVALGHCETRGDITTVSPVSKFSEVDIVLKDNKTTDVSNKSDTFDTKTVTSNTNGIAVTSAADETKYNSNLGTYKINKNPKPESELPHGFMYDVMQAYGFVGLEENMYYRQNSTDEWVLVESVRNLIIEEPTIDIKVGEYKIVSRRIVDNAIAEHEYYFDNYLAYYLTVELETA